jgi:DNA gyrase subunit A
MSTREDDSLQDLLVADTHDTLLFFTNRGRAYPLRCFDISEDSSRTTRGTPIINLLPIANGERVNAVLAVPDLRERGNVFVLATRRGQVKMLRPGDLAGIRAKGLIVMNIKEGDEVVSARIVKEGGDVILVSEMGQSIRFAVSEVRQTGRQAGGVGGIKLASGDQVVAMDVALQNGFLLTVSRNGYGKCTNLAYYRQQGRNGLGVRTFRASEATGPVITARVVTEAEGQEIMLVSAKGQVIRVSLQDFRVVGRNTQGVRIWRDKVEDDYVASLACLMPQDRGNEPVDDAPDPDSAPEAPVAVAAGSRNGSSAEPETVDDDDEGGDDGEE